MRNGFGINQNLISKEGMKMENNEKYTNGRDETEEVQQPNPGFETFVATSTEEIRVSESDYDISSFVTRSKIVGVQKKVLSTVELGRFPHDIFFRAHPTFQETAHLYESSTNRGMFYLIHPALLPALSVRERELTRESELILLIDPDKRLRLWPIRHPKSDNFATWFDLYINVAALARSKWLNFRLDTNDNKKLIYEYPIDQYPEPEWPDDCSTPTILKLAFNKNRLVTSRDHPILKKIRGEK
jgi:hypothetical protein